MFSLCFHSVVCIYNIEDLPFVKSMSLPFNTGNPYIFQVVLYDAVGCIVWTLSYLQERSFIFTLVSHVHQSLQKGLFGIKATLSGMQPSIPGLILMEVAYMYQGS